MWVFPVSSSLLHAESSNSERMPYKDIRFIVVFVYLSVVGMMVRPYQGAASKLLLIRGDRSSDELLS